MPLPLSDHFDGQRFFNPGANRDKGWRELLRWRRSRRPAPWPNQVANGSFPPPPDTVPPGQIAITYIGQATLLLQVNGVTLLTDPIFSDRAMAWFGPKRVRPPAVALDRLPPIDCVLLSHNHYDHMDLPSLRRLRDRGDPPIVTGLGNGRYLERKGLPHCVELDWWQAWQPRPDLSVRYVPARHWSSRHPFDRRRMLWGGHMVTAPAGRLYFAGDTAYSPHFQEIGRRLGAPDIALLPIGAYEPRWFMADQHIDPDEAVRAHRDLGAGLSIAMHFGTFPLADEAIDAPPQALALARHRHGVAAEAFRVPGFGETITWRKDSVVP